MHLARHRLVDDVRAALADRAHGQLRLKRHAQLADEDHVEWRSERGRNLVRDHNAAAWESEHDELVARQLGELGEVGGEPASGVRSILEPHQSSTIAPFLRHMKGRHYDCAPLSQPRLRSVQTMSASKPSAPRYWVIRTGPPVKPACAHPATASACDSYPASHCGASAKRPCVTFDPPVMRPHWCGV